MSISAVNIHSNCTNSRAPAWLPSGVLALYFFLSFLLIALLLFSLLFINFLVLIGRFALHDVDRYSPNDGLNRLAIFTPSQEFFEAAIALRIFPNNYNNGGNSFHVVPTVIMKQWFTITVILTITNNDLEYFLALLGAIIFFLGYPRIGRH